MAIPETGDISIKEAAGSSRSIDTAVTSVSSGSLVTLGENSIEYTDGRSSGTNDTNSSPYSMLEYAGYAHTSIDSWPSFEPSQWGTFGIAYHIVEPPSSNTAEGFASMKAIRDDANNRIKIETYSGTGAAVATTYTNYINYTGMSGATFAVKFSWTGGTTGPGGSNAAWADNNPVMAGFSEDTYYSLANNGSTRQFYWTSMRTSSGGNGYALQTFIDLVFTLKITVGGVDYTTSSTARDGSVSARRGLEP